MDRDLAHTHRRHTPTKRHARHKAIRKPGHHTIRVILEANRVGCYISKPVARPILHHAAKHALNKLSAATQSISPEKYLAERGTRPRHQPRSRRHQLDIPSEPGNPGKYRVRCDL